MKRGDEVEVRVERISDRGASSGDVGGREVHVAGAIPGDRVLARVLGRRKRRIEAQMIALLDPSPLRAEPRCRYFGDCGGCTRQNLIYPAQLDAKRQAVEDAFSEHGLLGGAPVAATIGTESIWYYRNKMEFSFGARRWLTDWEVASGEEFERDFALGFHVPGHFDRLLDLRECFLQSELSVRLVNGVREFARAQGFTPWNVRRAEGYLRHLVIRTPLHEPEVMLDLVTDAYHEDRMTRLAAWLHAEFPEVTTLVNTINDGVAQVATGRAAHVIFGDGVVHDRIGRHRFEIGPRAFFQTNTRQAERLYELAAKAADLRETDCVYDMYCGLGTISLFVADRAKKVVGLEIERDTVLCARRNAEANGVQNVRFVEGDLAQSLDDSLLERYGSPDLIILDPPRAGVHPKILAKLEEIDAARMVYVSCNPKTQAHDLARLRERYSIESIQPIDLFPHTDHVENVVGLRRRA